MYAWHGGEVARVLRTQIVELDKVCQTMSERRTLRTLVDRNAKLGGFPTTAEIFGVDIASGQVDETE